MAPKRAHKLKRKRKLKPARRPFHETIKDPSSTRWTTTSLNPNNPNQTFTCFPNLPAELRDMVWDEALKEFSVLSLNPSWRHDFFAYRKSPFTRHVVDHGQIALSCHEAADRWRLLHPLRQFLNPYKVGVQRVHNLARAHLNAALSGVRIRLREESTILLGPYGPNALHSYVEAAEFVPRHVAILQQTGSYGHADQLKWHAPNAQTIYDSRESITKANMDNQPLRTILEAIIRMAQKSEGPDREIIVSRSGREWLQCIRPLQNGEAGMDFAPVVEPEPVVKMSAMALRRSARLQSQRLLE